MTIHSHQDDYFEFLIEIPDSVDVPTELPAGHYYLCLRLKNLDMQQ